MKDEDTTYTIGLVLLWNSNGQYYMHNAHGDVTGLTDAQCNVTKTYTYDAFGIEQNIDSNDTNPFRYCGEYYDELTGDIYLRARYYRPSIGRFTQEDPAKDGLNWYVYCDSDPVNRIDITGLEWGYIRDFAKDLAMIFGGDPNYNFGYGGVRVTVGEEYYQKSGMFYFDGFVELQRNGGRSFTTQQVAQNNNGQLYMQRTDFYEAMNVKYVVDSQTLTVTEFENNIPSIIAGLLTGTATQKMNPKLAAVVGYAVDQVIKEFQLEPGEYRVEYTVAEVYNGALDLYESITTTSYYRLGINSKGEPTEQFVTSVTNYNGTFIDSVV